jgi:CRP-like cAMP-binding protein
LLLAGDIVRAPPESEDFHAIALASLQTCEVDNLVEDLERPSSASRSLADSWRELRRAEDLRRLRHVIRLGGMTAYERMADFLLDLWARQQCVRPSQGSTIDLPLTQEAVGQHLSLSTVHVNRTLQALRREGLVRTSRHKVWLDIPHLTHAVPHG